MPIKIFIDQGHNPGGINGGAEGNGLVEQEITYNVGIYLNNLLNNDYRFESMVSRENIDTILGTNNTTSLQTRVNMANTWGADYFISIHTNASESESLNGSEVYVYSQQSPAYEMAEDILDNIVELVGTRDNNVRINRALYVLRKTTMPALLVELAYITNPQDAEKLANDQYLFAYAIYRGILEYFDFEPLENN